MELLWWCSCHRHPAGRVITRYSYGTAVRYLSNCGYTCIVTMHCCNCDALSCCQAFFYFFNALCVKKLLISPWSFWSNVAGDFLQNTFLHKSLYHRLRCRDALPYMLNTSASTSNKPLSQEWWSLYIKLKETCFPSQEPSWVCSSLQTATSSGRIYECVSCSASYIHHSWGKLQAGVLQPSLCMVLVSSRGSSTPTSSCIEINML